MKTFIKVLAALLVIGGIVLPIVAAGGLEHDRCTYAEFFRLAGAGLLMLLIGAPLANACDTDDEGGYDE